MATKRTLLDVWLREPKKAAVEKGKPPVTLENVGIASEDHLKPRGTEKPHESGRHLLFIWCVFVRVCAYRLKGGEGL